MSQTISHFFFFARRIILEGKSFSIYDSNADSINPLITIMYVSFCANAVNILKFKYVDKIC